MIQNGLKILRKRFNLILQVESSLSLTWNCIFVKQIKIGKQQCDQIGKMKANSLPVWPVKSRQMSIKVAEKKISLKKLRILTPLQKLPKNVGDLG